MPTHVHKLDATLGDQAPNESGSRIQQLPCFVHREKAIHAVFTSYPSTLQMGALTLRLLIPVGLQPDCATARRGT
jgi:hypothetical protein